MVCAAYHDDSYLKLRMFTAHGAGGWKAMLDDLMRECEIEATAKNIPFKKFNLQDCRPMGVTDKLERGDTDTKNATGHNSEKMIATVYDRRT